MMRLAQAQGELVKSLEARFAQQERVVAALTASRAELDSLASSGGIGGLAFLPVALRNLAAAEAALSEANRKLEDVRKELLSAKGRHKALDTRARLLREASERKALEEDTLETALLMAAKASGKHDVVI